MDELPLTTGLPGAATAYRDAVHRVVTLRAGANRRIAEAAALDPGLAVARLLSVWQISQGSAPAAPPPIVERLEEIRRLVRGTTRFERHHVEIVVAAMTGRLPHALALAHEHLTEHPADVFVAFALSRANHGPSPDPKLVRPIVGLTDLVAADDRGVALAIRALARADAGDHEPARDLACGALALDPDNNLARHALDHLR